MLEPVESAAAAMVSPYEQGGCLARTVWGDEDPVGKQFGDPDPKETPKRVIGVVREFRKGGELAARNSFMFQHLRLDAPSWLQPRSILLKVRPGTPAAFEEELTRLLQGVAPDWSFQIKPLADERAATFRMLLAPLVAGGTVAFFLLLMVALGLFGVLWQNLLQRTRVVRRDWSCCARSAAAGRSCR